MSVIKIQILFWYNTQLVEIYKYIFGLNIPSRTPSEFYK